MPLLPLESTTEGSHFESAAFAGTQKKTTARTKSARPSGGVRAREEHADALPWTDVMVVLLAVLVVARFPSVRPGGSAWPMGQNCPAHQQISSSPTILVRDEFGTSSGRVRDTSDKDVVESSATVRFDANSRITRATLECITITIITTETHRDDTIQKALLGLSAPITSPHFFVVVPPLHGRRVQLVSASRERFSKRRVPRDGFC
jgi:hypothetical protein